MSKGFSTTVISIVTGDGESTKKFEAEAQKCLLVENLMKGRRSFVAHESALISRTAIESGGRRHQVEQYPHSSFHLRRALTDVCWLAD